LGGGAFPRWMVEFPVVVPAAELRLMAMYVTSVLAGKHRNLQDRIGHRGIRRRTW